MGNKLKDEQKSSKAFLKFEAYLFGKDDLSKSLFHMIDPSTMDGLDAEEKIVAEGMLKAALGKKFDRRWLWGLGDLKTESAYHFLLDLYDKEKVDYSKVRYAYTLLLMNKDAPVLEYLQGILDTKETIETRMKVLSALYWLYDKKFDDNKRHQLFLTILFDAMINKTKDIIYEQQQLSESVFKILTYEDLFKWVERLNSFTENIIKLHLSSQNVEMKKPFISFMSLIAGVSAVIISIGFVILLRQLNVV